jgi:hypothetical protein
MHIHTVKLLRANSEVRSSGFSQLRLLQPHYSHSSHSLSYRRPESSHVSHVRPTFPTSLTTNPAQIH